VTAPSRQTSAPRNAASKPVRGQRFVPAFLSVSGGVMLSRGLGLARDILFARVWGTGGALAGFLIAFTIPNLLRSLFGEGAFSSGFVPVLSHRIEREGRDAGFQAASRILSVLAVILAAAVNGLTGVALAGRVLFRRGLAGEVFRLLPIVAPYAFFVCLTAGAAGVLHVFRRFTAPALSPVILNAALILAALAALYSSVVPEQSILLAAWAVPAAGVIQLFVIGWACRRAGYYWRFRFEPTAPEVRETLRLVAPAAVGAAVLQLNVVVDRFLAGWLGATATTSLYYSQRLVYLPVGLFGVALSTVTLPLLARAAAAENEQAVRDQLLRSLRMVLFFAVPAAVLLGVLGKDVIRLLFERGRFREEGVKATAWALGFYLPGIPAFVAAKVAVTPFHARKDTTTPVRISLALLLLNLVLNIVFMQFLAQGGLALATTICSWLNVMLLLHAYSARRGPLGVSALLPATVRIGAGGLACAATAYAALSLLHHWAGARHSELLWRFLFVAVPGTAGGLSYLAAAILTRSGELRELVGATRPPPPGRPDDATPPLH